MSLKRIFVISIAILISSSLAFALTHTSPNYALKDAKIVVSAGKANSDNYSFNDVGVGSVFGGVATSANYSIDATNLAKGPTPESPNPPTVNPVTSPTDISTQTLTGTKDKDTAIYINGYLIVPLDSETTWSYEITLVEGNNDLIITARNKYGLDSESVLVTIILDTTPAVLSISVSSNSWDLGEVQPGSTVTMSDAQKIIVTNNGEGKEDFILSLSNPADWTASSQPALEEYVLNAAFSNFVENITWNEENHLVATGPATSTETRFAGEQNGMNVPSGENRNLFLQFKSPTASETSDVQSIRLIISCEIPAE